MRPTIPSEDAEFAILSNLEILDGYDTGLRGFAELVRGTCVHHTSMRRPPASAAGCVQAGRRRGFQLPR